MVLIITGGKAPPISYIEHLLVKDPYVVAADSGLDYCEKWAISPNYIIGDMDSLKNIPSLDKYPSDMVEVHPKEKDYSDTELALMHVQTLSEMPVLIGGGEGRLDHSLALLALFQQEYCPVRWITAHEDIHLIKGKHTFPGIPGQKVSIFPLKGNDFRCNSRGLQWPLDDVSWDKGCFSLSNSILENRIELDVLSGRGLLMLSIPESARQD